MATIEELSAALIKADAAGNTADAKAFANAIRQMRATPAPSEGEGIPGARQEPSIARQAGQFLGNIAAGAVRGAGSIGATLIRPFETAAENEARRRAMDEVLAELGAEPSSMTYGAGKLATEIAGTAGVGGVLAAPLKFAGPAAAPLAQALRTSGFSTGQAVRAAPIATRAADIGTRAAGGAITGGASSALTSPEEAGTGAMVGAALPFVAPPVLNVLAKGVGKLASIRDIPNQLAAQTVRKSLGSPEQIEAARLAMQQAPADLTAQQALARAGVISPTAQATIEKAIEKGSAPGKKSAADTRSAIEAAQESARKSTIQGITPDVEAAVTARKNASQPLYEAADKAVVPIDADIADVISRMPQGTLSAAANIAKMEGRPFIIGKTAAPTAVETGVLDAAGRPVMRQIPGETAEITGESMHYIKRALSDIAYGPATTDVGRDTQLAARKLLGDYVKAFETKVPEYGQARRIYSDLSAPVNQAQVLKEMLSVLEKPGGGERIGPFLNTLGRGEEAMLKRAGGRGAARFESLDEVLTPDQLAKVREVARQLETQSAIKFQTPFGIQRASDLIKDELTVSRIPNPLNVLISVANRLMETLGARVGKKTIAKIADAAMSANSFDELLATLPANERNSVLKAVGDPETWSKLGKTAATIGSRAAVLSTTTTNNLAPEPRNENALAR